AARLQGQFFAWLRQIHPANLEQRHALAIATVGPQRLQHTGQQRLPQKFALLTDWIGQPYVGRGLHGWSINLGAAHAVETGEAVRDNLRETTADENIARLLYAGQQWLRVLGRQDVLDERKGDRFVAVIPGDIFNQIRRNRHVQAVARHLHLQTWIPVVDTWRAPEVQRG